MKNNKKITRNSSESGNALFLILIAVALFAALSYAITQSGRGGGSVSAQTVLITAGQVTQTPADVRSSVTRMILTGVPATSVTFTGAASANDVFDQKTGGGGATDIPPPSAACGTAADCAAWIYAPAYGPSPKNGFFVLGVGSVGVSGSDAMALLQGAGGLTLQVCSAIQKGLGFSSVTPPTLLATVVMTSQANVTTALGGTLGYAAGGNAQTIADAGTLSNQDFACVSNNAKYAYYATLIDQ